MITLTPSLSSSIDMQKKTMGWDCTPDVAARTIVDPTTSGQTFHYLKMCKVGTSPGCALEAVFGCLLINSLETTTRGDTDALNNLEMKQHTSERILVWEVI